LNPRPVDRKSNALPVAPPRLLWSDYTWKNLVNFGPVTPE